MFYSSEFTKVFIPIRIRTVNRSGVSIATSNLHQYKPEQSCFFEHANDNIHLPLNLLSLIVNGLQFTHDNVFSIECIIITVSINQNQSYYHHHQHHYT